MSKWNLSIRRVGAMKMKVIEQIKTVKAIVSNRSDLYLNRSRNVNLFAVLAVIFKLL